MNYSKLLVLTFVVTALWDLVLQFLSKSYKDLPKVLRFNFIKYLKEYFENHTVLGAASIAGVTGVLAQLIIISILKFPRKARCDEIINFLLLTFLVSGLFGFIMKLSQMYPYLVGTYYHKLGPFAAFYHDGVSGLLVQISLLVLYAIKESLERR